MTALTSPESTSASKRCKPGRFRLFADSPASHAFQRPYLTQSPLGYGRPRRMIATGLRLKEPHRVVVPLSADEVAKFWRSFRTFRDLALVAQAGAH